MNNPVIGTDAAAGPRSGLVASAMSDVGVPVRDAERRSRWPVRLIVLIGIALPLLCDAFVGYILSTNYRETLRAAATADTALVRTLDEYVRRSFEGIDLLLQTTADDLDDNPGLRLPGNAALIAHLAQRASYYPMVRDLAIVDDEGNLLADSQGNGGLGRSFNFADRPTFQALRTDPDKGLFIAPPLPSRVEEGRQSMTIGRALPELNGRFRGIVSATLDYQAVRQFFLSLDVGSDGAVSLFRDDALLLVRVPTGEDAVGTAQSSTQLFQSYLPQATTGSFKGSPESFPGPIARHVTYRKVDGLPLVVVVARNEVEFLSGWRANAWSYGAAAAALNLLIVALAAFLARQWHRREGSERMLQESLAQHHLVTDNLPVLILRLDADLRVRFANRVAEDWYARPLPEVIGHQLADILGHELVAELRPTIEATLAGRATRIAQKVLFPDGRTRWVDYIRVPDIGEGGRVLGFFVLGVDITERKTLEESLIAAKSEADAASRAKTQFLANMSHELRTPLNAVIGFSEIIRDESMGPVGTPRYAEYAADIWCSGRHLLDIVNDILDMSKVESGKLALSEDACDIADVAATSVGMLRELAEKGDVRLSVEVPRTLPALWADRVRLRQVLINLLSNAVKFTPPGGTVSLRCHIDEAGDCVLSVQDTGIGMTAEEIETALEPFGQADAQLARKFEGTGLGLPLTKRLVELHGGRLDIVSAPSVGTTVSARFPAHRVRPVRERPRAVGA